jgi:3-isopropylmalate/(R)-2-methylmalate dehydratase small subunit
MKGKVVLILENDVSTDTIYPGRFMATVLPSETPRHAFADQPDFNTELTTGRIPPGSILIAGSNFGCGSSREQAVSALVGHQLTVVARSFARIFLQNSVNLGLVTVTCPDIVASLGDDLEIRGEELWNATTGRRHPIVPLPPARQAILEAGGLINYTRHLLSGTRT